MKHKFAFLLSFIFICHFSVAAPSVAPDSNPDEVQVKKGKKKKNGRYKKRKKLFKRKNQCDCPKH